MPKPSSHLGLGALYALLAGFCYSIMGVLVKIGTGVLPPPMIFWGRQLFSIALLSPWVTVVTLHQGATVLHTHRMSTHLMRMLFSAGAGYCVVFSLSMISLSDAIALNWTRPLWIPFVLWVWRGRKVKPSVWFGLITGFVGVLFILQPRVWEFVGGGAIALFGGVCGAVAILLIRSLTKTEPTVRILGYYFFFSVVVTGGIAALDWATPTLFQWLLLLGIGGTGMVYQFFLTMAYRKESASLVSSVLYTAVVFALGWDVLILGWLPRVWSLVGIALVIIGAIITLVLGGSQGVSNKDRTQ